MNLWNNWDVSTPCIYQKKNSKKPKHGSTIKQTRQITATKTFFTWQIEHLKASQIKYTKKKTETGRRRRMRTLPNDTENFSIGMNFPWCSTVCDIFIRNFHAWFCCFLHRRERKKKLKWASRSKRKWRIMCEWLINAWVEMMEIIKYTPYRLNVHKNHNKLYEICRWKKGE